MAFILIDLDNWERREHYLYFINEVRCSYSVCVNLDISNLNGQRLYPAMLWLLTRTVNDMRKMPENIPSLRSMSQSPEDLQIRLMFPWYRGFLLLRSI